VLNTLTKVKVRFDARRAWMEGGCNPALAEEYFRDRYADASDELTTEAVAFAFGFWQHWIDRGVSEPSVVASGDEPMGFED
jgi:hypothetical protein